MHFPCRIFYFNSPTRPPIMRGWDNIGQCYRFRTDIYPCLC
jgi:hypothetical protein